MGGSTRLQTALAHDVDLTARTIFRSARVVLLETDDATRRRFTVILDGYPADGSAKIRICSLWRHPVGAASVHRLVWGEECYEFDAHGVLHRDGRRCVPAPPTPLPIIDGEERCAGCGGSIDPPDLVFSWVDGMIAAPYWHPGCNPGG
jgi:hypothetical protein